jgi:hypothetical protein
VDDGGSAVSGFTARGGRLTEIDVAQTRLPAGATPFGIVVT